MEVNKERVKLWVVALRSKRFKQGTGRLGRIYCGETTNCCLGVACEVAKENGLEIRRIERHGRHIEYGGAVGQLPAKVVKWFGLPDKNPNLGPETCVAVNDSLKYSFRRIATLIERRYLNSAKTKKASK